MPEESKFLFSHKEIVETMIKKQNIHEGIWRLYVEFGLGGGNVGPTPDKVVPTAFLGVLRIGILRAKDDAAEDALSVDAAKVNPGPDSPTAGRRSRE